MTKISAAALNVLLLGIACLLQATSAKAQVTAPDQLRFNQTTITDTIAAATAKDSKSRYWFVFTNTGEKPVIIKNVVYGDPDFACSIPRNPVTKGKKDSIEICLDPHQLTMNLSRQYRVDYLDDHSSLHSIQLTLRRVLLSGFKHELHIAYTVDSILIPLHKADRNDLSPKELIYVQDQKEKRLYSGKSLKNLSNARSKKLGNDNNDYDRALEYIRRKMRDSIFSVALSDVNLDTLMMGRLRRAGMVVNDSVIINTNRALGRFKAWEKSSNYMLVFPGNHRAARYVDSYSAFKFRIKLSEDNRYVLLDAAFDLYGDVHNQYFLKEYLILKSVNTNHSFMKPLHSDNIFNRLYLSSMIEVLSNYMSVPE